jgi:subtilisin family serine protease
MVASASQIAFPATAGGGHGARRALYGMVFYPVRFPGVVAVGASTQADTRASVSNYGDRLDLVAPGVGIFSTLRGSGFSSYGLYNGSGTGTSFATPHVAGAAALVRGLRPDLGHTAVRDHITATVTDLAPPGFDPETGWGRLDAFGAVYSAMAGLCVSLRPSSANPGNHLRWVMAAFEAGRDRHRLRRNGNHTSCRRPRARCDSRA